MLRMLVFLGPRAVLPILRDAGVELEGDLASICHMCWEIFSNPTNGRIVREWFETRERDALYAAITEFAAEAGVEPAPAS